MTTEDNGAAIIDQLRGLKAVKCRLAHEHVALDRETGRPLDNPAIPGAFLRVDLCPAALRRCRIACGHTDARRWFREGIAVLAGRCGADNPEVSALGAEFSRLDVELGQLDHAKGDAEAAVAAVIAGRAAARTIDALADARAEAERIADRHGDYVDAFAGLRDRLVAALER